MVPSGPSFSNTSSRSPHIGLSPFAVRVEALQPARMPRLAAMVEDDFLIEVAQVVEHVESCEELPHPGQGLGQVVDLVLRRVDGRSWRGRCCRGRSGASAARRNGGRRAPRCPGGPAASPRRAHARCRARSEDPAAILRPAEQRTPSISRQPRHGVVDQRALMRRDRVIADRADVVDRRVQADAFDDRRRAGLELMRRRRPVGTF